MIKWILFFLLIPSIGFCDSESTIGGKTAQAHIIQNNGVSLRPRPYLNLTGGVTCTDTGGKTVCNMTGGGGGSGNPGGAQGDIQFYDVQGTVTAFGGNSGFFYSGAGSGSGNVGIGSTNPGQKLDIQGVIRTTGFTLASTPTNNYVLTSNSSGNGTWQPTQATGSGTVASGTIGQEAVYTGSTTIGSGVITDNGTNVGIGTSSALNAQLTVNGTVLVTGGNPGTFFGGNGFQFDPNNSTGTSLNPSLTMLSTGNVGIGTGNTTPAASVDILGNTFLRTLPGDQLTFNLNGTNFGHAYSTNGDSTEYFGASTGINTVPASPIFDIDFDTNNVGIGTALAKRALDVQGTIRMTGFNMPTSVTNNYVLTTDASGNGAWKPAAGGSASAAGGNNAVQYNSGSSTFAGNEAILSFNGTNVGIGTVNGVNLLDVQGTLKTSDFMGGVGIGTTFAQSGYPGNNGLGALNIMNGNVGIGTWKPNTSLQIGNLTGYAGSGSGVNISTGSVTTSGSVNVGGTIACESLVASNCGFTNGAVSQYFGGAAATWTLNNAGSAGSDGLIVGGAYSGSKMLLQTSSVNSSNGMVQIQGGNNGATKIATFMDAGNVGIGSTNPGQILDVNGTVRTTGFILSTSPTNNYVLTSDSNGNGSWNPSSSGSGTVNSGTTGQGAYYNSSTTAVSGTNAITFTGNTSTSNVGIGSANPGSFLDVDGTVRIINGNLGIGTVSPSALFSVGNNQFTTSGSTTVIASPNVGTKVLTITGNSLSTNGVSISSASGSVVDNSPLFLINATGTTGNMGGLQVNTASNNGGSYVVKFQDASVDPTPFLIDPSGNVGIGTITPISQLDVRFQSPTDPFHIGNGLNDINGNFLRMDGNGNVGIGSTNPGQVLDVKGTIRVVGDFVDTDIATATAGTLVCVKANGGLGQCATLVGVICSSCT